MTKIEELFGVRLDDNREELLINHIIQQTCPYDRMKKCSKARKGQSDISIGTCSVNFDGLDQPIIICPKVFSGRACVFRDCAKLLQSDLEASEIVVVPEVSVTSGRVDYCLAARDSFGNLTDYVGIEIQSLDTNGSLWDIRQQELLRLGLKVEKANSVSSTPTVNWRMSAKTILVQIMQKSEVFHQINKILVLVCQKPFFDFMKANFNFQGVHQACLDDTLHFHIYDYVSKKDGLELECSEKLSADIETIRSFLLLDAKKPDLDRFIADSIDKRSKSDGAFSIDDFPLPS